MVFTVIMPQGTTYLKDTHFFPPTMDNNEASVKWITWTVYTNLSNKKIWESVSRGTTTTI